MCILPLTYHAVTKAKCYRKRKTNGRKTTPLIIITRILFVNTEYLEKIMKLFSHKIYTIYKLNESSMFFA